LVWCIGLSSSDEIRGTAVLPFAGDCWKVAKMEDKNDQVVGGDVEGEKAGGVIALRGEEIGDICVGEDGVLCE